MLSSSEYGFNPILLAVDGNNWNTPTAPWLLLVSCLKPDSVFAMLSVIAGSTPISTEYLTIAAFTASTLAAFACENNIKTNATAKSNNFFKVKIKSSKL